MSGRSEDLDRSVGALTPAGLRALYDFAPDGVLFTVPDGRVLAANPAACELLARSEVEICALGRHGLADRADPRWGPLIAERARNGRVRGIARMVRGDGMLIEVEMSAQIFGDADGRVRSCTIIRDVTDRVRMERALVEMSAQLRELTLTDELTGLLNRRGFLTVAKQLLELADRQAMCTAMMFLDLDNLKEINDRDGHQAGDVALRAVALALGHALRSADTFARIGGDEFVGLTVGIDDRDHESTERRLRAELANAPTLAALGRPVEVSVGWATRAPRESKSLDDLLAEADRAMYRAKAANHADRRRGSTGGR